MPILDDLSGLEFESQMVTVLRNYGYDDVHQTPKTGDKGRDIVMTESVNGHREEIVVECKHVEQVPRDVIQKLHSSLLTYPADVPTKHVRGMVVTSGTFSEPAQEHVETIKTNADGVEIELVDGNILREIADEIGLDLQNSTVGVVCRQTLIPGAVKPPVTEQFDAIANIDGDDLGQIDATARFRPVASIETKTEDQCQTSTGRVLEQWNKRDTFHVHGGRPSLQPIDDSLRHLLSDGGYRTAELEEWTNAEVFTNTTVEEFQHPHSDFEAWTADQLQAKYTKTVPYTGKNNRDYDKECKPAASGIEITDLTTMFVPRIQAQTQLKGYDYTLTYDAAGPDRHIIDNGIAHCVHCGWSWTPLTYCANCGSINCWRHTRTERVEGEPICTECAITERFGLRKRFFYDEDNRSTFSEDYAQFSLPQKLLENKLVIVGWVLVVILALLLVL